MHLDSVCTCCVCVCVCVCAGVGGFVFGGEKGGGVGGGGGTPAVLQFKVTNCAAWNLGCTTRGQ